MVSVPEWQPLGGAPFWTPAAAKAVKNWALKSLPGLTERGGTMKTAKLKKRNQFVEIANKGRKIVSSGLILQSKENALGINRIGFTVTKKVGNAVIRNRVRRRLREVVRLGLPAFDKTGYDFVIIGRMETIRRPFKDLQADFSKLIAQIWCARIMKKPRYGF